MRYVSIDALPVTRVAGDEIKPVVGIRPVRPVRARSNQAGETGLNQTRGSRDSPLVSIVQGRRLSSDQGRRKVARRLSPQPALLELRSDIDRRRQNLRDGDIVEHVDVKA